MFTEDYFNIDDILSRECGVRVQFRVRGHTLAHLDPLGVSTKYLEKGDAAESSTGPDDIPQGHILPLPFWLAESLAERGCVDVSMPSCYGTRARNELRADAQSVQLYKKCPSYFLLGIHIASLLKDPILPAMLIQAYADRCWNIVDRAAYGVHTAGRDTVRNLDNWERNMFFIAREVAVAIANWKERNVHRIVPKVLAPASVSRKRSAAHLDNATESSRLNIFSDDERMRRNIALFGRTPTCIM